MKRLVFCIVVAGLALTANAQDALTFIAPKDPRFMALGGTFAATSSGYESLYGNPAAFALPDKELTLPSLVPWLYLRPADPDLAAYLSALNGPDDQLLDTLQPLFAGNGLGAGASMGLGWTGKGLGLGLLTAAEAYVHGDDPLSATGKLDAQLEVIVGLGFPVKLSWANLYLGGDLRPFMRITGPISAVQLGAMLNGQGIMDSLGDSPVYLGFGLAMDLGARLDFGRLLSIGLVVRDISTPQAYGQFPASELDDALSGNASPSSTGNFTVLPAISAGVALRPLPESLADQVDVLVSLDLQDPLALIREGSSFWNMVHAGVEASFFKGVVALRGGLNRGHWSGGFGLDLFVFELNLAVFTEELGTSPGDSPRTGFSAEFSIRF